MEERNLCYTELGAWKKARILKKELTDSFAPEEKHRLTDQLIRSSRSVNAAISEEHGRLTDKDQLPFCIQARGSLSETYNHLTDAPDNRYISQTQFDYFKPPVDETGHLLNGYISFPRKTLNNY